MKNPRTCPSGRTRLLRPAQPVPAAAEEATPREAGEAADLQRSPRAWRSGIPLSHGKVSEQQIAAWRRECLRRMGTTEGRNKERWDR